MKTDTKVFGIIRRSIQPYNQCNWRTMSMKIDSSLMFDPLKVGVMAGQLEAAGFDGAYTFEGQSDPFISLSAAP
jgi:hypothetical protein